MSIRLSKFLSEFGDSDGVFYLGHAAILVVLGGKRILFDPIMVSQPYGDSWVFFPPQVDDRRLFEVDAVVVSHIHQDHYDIEFLRQLGPDVDIIVVGNRPEFEADIATKSGKHITIVEPEQALEIFDGVFLFGVTHETNGVDASAIIYNNKFCIYHGNDNYLTAASLQKFSNVHPSIDVACIPYAYIHWYPFLMDYPPEMLHEKEAEADRLVRMYMEDCISAISILRPKVVIPFGANLLINDGDMHSEINMAVKTPVEFVEYAREATGIGREAVLPMLAGDFCGKVGEEIVVDIAEVMSPDQYRDAAHQFLKELPPRALQAGVPTPNCESFVEMLNQRLTLADKHAIDDVLRFELECGDRVLRFEIDCTTCRAEQVQHFSVGRPYHMFILDQASSAEWLNGKRFEEIVGMRRFRFRREPNHYSREVLKLINTII